jgi:hypothetical protein
VNTSKKALWTGRVLSSAIAVFLLTSGINLMFVQSPDVRRNFALFGYPPGIAETIGLIEFVCALIYLVPWTSILGAILLTGYLGGAVATHVRVSDPVFVAPLVLGILTWFALYLRDGRLRSLFSLRAA